MGFCLWDVVDIISHPHSLCYQFPVVGSRENNLNGSLDAVYLLISDDDKLFQQKTFVICPGSVMEVGFLVPGVGIDQGQAPIVPRSNTEYLCGEDGKSENNCIIKGGDFGVIAVNVLKNKYVYFIFITKNPRFESRSHFLQNNSS